jgi:hypothetical protein
MKDRKKGPPATLFPDGSGGLIGAEAYENTSSNGLIRVGIRFGMTRPPTGGATPRARAKDLRVRHEPRRGRGGRGRLSDQDQG